MMNPKLRHELELLFVLSFMDLKLKYQNSMLGFFWSFLKPLLQFLAYFVIFSVFLKVSNNPDYPLQLFFGVLIWVWFAEATNLGMASYASKQSIITKIKTNKSYPPIAAFLTPTMNYVLNLVIFIIAYCLFAKQPAIHANLLNIAIIIESYLALSLIIVTVNIILANLNVLYRDIQPIWELVLNYGVFITPIIYHLPIPDKYAIYYYFVNPLAFPIINLKSVFFSSDQALYQNGHYLLAHFTSLGLLAFLAKLTYKKISPKIVDFI